MYRGEGLRQVGSFYLDICENYRSICIFIITLIILNHKTSHILLPKAKVPSFLVYDNACQLMLHIKKQFKNRTHRTKRLEEATKVNYIVDRLHIVGHSQAWCKDVCHPDLFPELKGVNTIICEQINFWLGRFKFIMKHMNQCRFNFFLYIILNQYNKLKVEDRFNTTADFKFVKTQAQKRSLEEISDDEDV